MNTLGTVVLTPYLALKFLISPTKVGGIHANQKEAREYYHESLRRKGKEAGIEGTPEVHIVETNQHKKMNIRDLDPREEGRERPEQNDELQKNPD